MDGRLQGKRALVTGASAGIGRAIAESFIDEGAHVFLTARHDLEGLAPLLKRAQLYSGQVGYLLCDAQDMPVERVFVAAEQAIGPLDILVNNPAFVSSQAFIDTTPDDFERSVTVNFQFPFFMTQRFANSCIATGRSGSVINISSISAFRAVSRLTTYQATKAALSMLTKSCAVELAAHGIRVNAISPGLTATKGNAHQWRDDPARWAMRGNDIPMGRPGTPADIAGAAVFLASHESAWMTGADVVVDGGDSCL
ncbi:SDR family NAD(P)-dependent oxidoreductase [Stenotrophomonas maltophilia]|uniref:SDR family NAD(P)-dependent oxidoreductase n=1 Tax=Stenotrophomonas maltophilia TaxID=40324 RepID=UPI0009B2AE49|nr:SDR family oxidoreductase [Stenotrophomonas maltophilia]